MRTTSRVNDDCRDAALRLVRDHFLGETARSFSWFTGDDLRHLAQHDQEVLHERIQRRAKMLRKLLDHRTSLLRDRRSETRDLPSARVRIDVNVPFGRYPT